MDQIKAVATDMSSVYHAAVVKNLPNAKQVFDRFHITKLMNDKLTQLRRDVQAEAATMDRNVLKGLRWLLLKHPENLDDSKNERVRLQEALDLNRSLAVAYYLKEDLSQIWQQTSTEVAARFLTDLCRQARASGIRVLLTMANTLEGYRTGILNWYDYPISSGPMEGVNNKIGALQRMAYGYRILLGFSWLSFTGFQTEFSAVKQNSNSVVFKDTEATRRGFDRLNPAVESFSDSVTDRRSKPRQDSVEAILQHPCDLLDGIEPAADCP